jgi:hypothetical protein
MGEDSNITKSSATPLAQRDLLRAFDLVYESSRWSSQGNKSGPGSEYANCKRMCDELTSFISAHAIRKIVDVSCGGMAWWPHVLQKLDIPIEFHGFDASSIIIAENVETFRSHSNLHFETADARSHQFPECDLLVCRQTLNHLWRDDCVAVLRNLRSLKYRFLALTHNGGVERNLEDGERIQLMPPRVEATRYTPLNLMRPPYSMPKPCFEFEDVENGTLALFEGRG